MRYFYRLIFMGIISLIWFNTRANPIMIFYIYELNPNPTQFAVEIFYPEIASMNGWYLTSLTDTAYFKDALWSNGDFILITRDSLKSSFYVNKSGDVVTLHSPEGVLDQMVFGNQPTSTIAAPKTGQSICLKVYSDIFQRYYLYLDNTPTLGQPNDSSGAMGWIEGIVADSSGTPLSGIEIIYDYVETDWVTTIKKSVFTDSSGYFIFREMARCLSLYYNTGEKEDHYLSRQQIWPDDTLSIQVKINYIDQLPDQEKISGIIYFELNQNYPNPFNALTCIKFVLSRRVPVELNIYNMYGQRIVTLMNEERSAGIHQATWDGRNFASGLYYYQLKAGDQMLYKKLLLIK